MAWASLYPIAVASTLAVSVLPVPGGGGPHRSILLVGCRP